MCIRDSINSVKEQIKTWNLGLKPADQGPDRPAILEAEHVSFQYTKKRKILKDVSFSIKEGEMVSIVGTNGAGKSTLAKLICGFITEDEGRFLFEGEDLKGKTIKERSDKIGFVMQNPNQMICKPMIYEEVALWLHIRGVEEAEVEDVYKRQGQSICRIKRNAGYPMAS